MEIKSLHTTSFELLFEAFGQAFADYELQLSTDQLKAMLKRRGFNPDLSFAAFDGKRIVSFTFNGVGNFNGTPTVYDTGTGTLKEYRGKGLVTEIFNYSIPWLKKAGMKQYLLEVLQHNTKAVSIYKNLGFETSRNFYYFRQENEKISNDIKETNFSFTIKQMDIENFTSIADFQDFYPSWQNSDESIKRADKELIYLGAFTGNKLIGYAVFEPTSGDITQLTIDKPYRRKGIASVLLQEMVRLNKNTIIKIINTDVSCHSITSFLKAKNIDIKGKQFEMIKKMDKPTSN